MKLDCVLTAVNENKLYIDFIPIFIKTWNKLYPDVDVKIVLIAKSIPKDFLLYKKNIILFEPIENVLTSFTAQFIRLLYPCILNYKNGVMITDMDNLPMNNTYYTKNIEHISNNKWINLRDWRTRNQICMMWQVAIPETWKQVFNIENLQDIKNTLVSVYSKINYVNGSKKGAWFTDQIFLYKKVMKWNETTKNYIFLKDSETKHKRLNRSKCNISDVNVRKNIVSGKYSDYHCCRPMSKHYKKNWEIYNLLDSNKK